MLMIVFIGCYIALSLALAIQGRRTKIGPVLIFLVSMFLTPLAAMLYVLIAQLETRSVEPRTGETGTPEASTLETPTVVPRRS
jgi:hypothetical protein